MPSWYHHPSISKSHPEAEPSEDSPSIATTPQPISESAISIFTSSHHLLLHLLIQITDYKTLKRCLRVCKGWKLILGEMIFDSVSFRPRRKEGEEAWKDGAVQTSIATDQLEEYKIHPFVRTLTIRTRDLYGLIPLLKVPLALEYLIYPPVKSLEFKIGPRSSRRDNKIEGIDLESGCGVAMGNLSLFLNDNVGIKRIVEKQDPGPVLKLNPRLVLSEDGEKAFLDLRWTWDIAKEDFIVWQNSSARARIVDNKLRMTGYMGNEVELGGSRLVG